MRLRVLVALFVVYMLVSVAVFFWVQAEPGDAWKLVSNGEKKDSLVRCVGNDKDPHCIFVEAEPKRNSTTPGSPGK